MLTAIKTNWKNTLKLIPDSGNYTYSLTLADGLQGLRQNFCNRKGEKKWRLEPFGQRESLCLAK